MAHIHITTDELVVIEAYFHRGTAVAQIAKRLGRARQTIHNVITHFKAGHTMTTGLNEHSNGLIRRDGLPKDMNFNTVDQTFVSSVAARRNHTLKKSLNYRTPLDFFPNCMD